jgi:hypothetical protein
MTCPFILAFIFFQLKTGMKKEGRDKNLACIEAEGV